MTPPARRVGRFSQPRGSNPVRSGDVRSLTGRVRRFSNVVGRVGSPCPDPTRETDPNREKTCFFFRFRVRWPPLYWEGSRHEVMPSRSRVGEPMIGSVLGGFDRYYVYRVFQEGGGACCCC